MRGGRLGCEAGGGSDDSDEGRAIWMRGRRRDSDVSARAFVNRFKIPYPNVIDRDGQLQLLFGDSLPPQAIPSTLVIDSEGRVAARALGKVSESSLRAMVEPLLAARTE